ncbi:modulator of macroautophagy TMEM150B [Neoarius graeffei]|uniref:modulator of macroautophagy TMEM150B n=1 Tax=Neoarius graeffei TaxID=443677 RepID=UPI00298D2DFE|nr:modulator of macroautophagy TMEM150B [Neoarius graeffei]
MWAWVLLPVILALFGTIGIWTVFALAVSNETVNLTIEFPYISTCGTYNPQSCLFSQICNICSVLALWIVIIRFQQVRDLNCASRVNTASLVLGFISSIGISILGNFQQSVVKGAHLLGAFLAFFVGLAYFWLQVWLTYYTKPSCEQKWVGPARITFCSLCTCLVLAMSVLHNTGYRSASAICEWALVMCFFMLFAVFSAEFYHIDCHELHVQNEGLSKISLAFPTQQSNVVAPTG